MGLLTFSINVTLDGCVDHQEGIADDETTAFFTRLMNEGGAMLWGRVTYEMMESYWPAVARGDVEAALGHFRRALKSGQPAGEPALRGGRLAQALGDLSQARFFFQEADRTDPESCWATMARRALEGMKTPSPEPR